MATPTSIVDQRKRQLMQQRAAAATADPRGALMGATGPLQQRQNQLMQQVGAAAPALGAGAARFVRDMESRMARGPLETSGTTPAGLPVGMNSSLSGTERQVQVEQNYDRHQVNRQKRVQRMLDRSARRGNINDAIRAEEFGARMEAEGGPRSQITSSEQGRNFAREKLSQEWQFAQELRRPPSAGQPMTPEQVPRADQARPTGGPTNPNGAGQLPGGFTSTLDQPQGDASPGEWGMPPADATSDSGTNGSTSAALRDVPESDTAPPVAPAATAPPPAAPTPPASPESPTPTAPPPTGLDAAAGEVLAPELTAEQRAAKAFGVTIFNEGMPMKRNPETGRYEPIPAQSWNEAVERERTFMGMEKDVAALSQNAALQDPEFIARTNARIKALSAQDRMGISDVSPMTPQIQTNDVGAVVGVNNPAGVLQPAMGDQPMLGQYRAGGDGGWPITTSDPVLGLSWADFLDPTPYIGRPGQPTPVPNVPQMTTTVPQVGPPLEVGAVDEIPAFTRSVSPEALAAASGIANALNAADMSQNANPPRETPEMRRDRARSVFDQLRTDSGSPSLFEDPRRLLPLPGPMNALSPGMQRRIRELSMPSAPTASVTIPGTRVPLAPGQRALADRFRQPSSSPAPASPGNLFGGYLSGQYA